MLIRGRGQIFCATVPELSLGKLATMGMGARKANERNWVVWDHDPIESEANDPRHASREY